MLDVSPNTIACGCLVIFPCIGFHIFPSVERFVCYGLFKLGILRSNMVNNVEKARNGLIDLIDRNDLYDFM